MILKSLLFCVKNLSILNAPSEKVLKWAQQEFVDKATLAVNKLTRSQMRPSNKFDL